MTSIEYVAAEVTWLEGDGAWRPRCHLYGGGDSGVARYGLLGRYLALAARRGRV